MSQLSSSSECVRVVVRIRPLSGKEKTADMQAVAVANEARACVTMNPLKRSKDPPKSFTFDQVYGPDALQKNIYDRTASTIVESVCEGYNGTIFAYGQTGAGKTHTMEGLAEPAEERGIIPNSFKHIFDKVSLERSETTKFLIRASYLEIYNEEIRDLLAENPKNRLELRENDGNVYVKDQKVIICKNVKEITRVMNNGKKHRHTGATLMNQSSSRSHSIFTVIIERSELCEASNEVKIRVGKLNLVDLAGSERQSKTGATGDRLKEATRINLSLSALGNVISALVEAKSHHIPYRDSKLTRLLQDSLGGNTKTVMIANCGPADYNFDETLSTLRYANRAKDIKNKPKINEDPKDAMLREFQDEISRLRAQLEGSKSGGIVLQPGQSESTGAMEYAVDGMEASKIRERLEKKLEEEKKSLLEENERKIEMMEREHKLSEMERQKIAAKLKREGEQTLVARKAKEELQEKLKVMEEKLLIGGIMMDKAAKQEQELRQAEAELEERKIQQRILARKIAEKEEEVLIREEQYSSLQDEVDSKTKKIKKIWNKYQLCKSEIKDAHDDFQREREEMLFTIREMTKQNKLKQLVIENFIPSSILDSIVKRATFDQEREQYSILGIDFDNMYGCDTIHPPKPALFNCEEVMKTIEFHQPKSDVKSYYGTLLDHSVHMALEAALESEDEEVILDSCPQNLPSPFLKYDSKDTKELKKKHKRTRVPSDAKHEKSRRRPQTAHPSTGTNRRTKREAKKADEELYPTAKGLISEFHV